MSIDIVPIQRRHVAGFREVVDGVARERRWLVMQEEPPLSRIRRFVLDNMRDGAPQFVAVEDDRVVGWCDVKPKVCPSQRHSGVLGMGVAATHRGRGVGTALLRATLDAAATRGLTRIELVVRADNHAAVALYERHGFELEGRLRGYLIVDDVASDALQMAKVSGLQDCKIGYVPNLAILPGITAAVRASSPPRRSRMPRRPRSDRTWRGGAVKPRSRGSTSSRRAWT